MPEPGPAFYIGAEDEADELRHRLVAIADHHGATFKELIEGGLYIRSLAKMPPCARHKAKAAGSK